MPSLMSRAVMPAYLKITRANAVSVDPAVAHKRVAQRSIRPRPYGPPRRLRRDVEVTVERAFGWPVFTLSPTSGRARGSLMYLHGGAWVNEISLQHWQLAAQIAAESQTTVTVPIYPLVPFGTAAPVTDTVCALALANSAKYGSASLAGDSAGGQIALSAALQLRDEHEEVVPQTVLIAPGLDLTLNNPEIDLVQPTDPWLARPGLRVLVEYWRGDLPVEDPRVSPLFADLHGLGPLTVFGGTRDILNPDIRLLVDKARAAGVSVDHHEEPGLVHVYPLTPTAEGRAARAAIVDSVRAARP